MLLVAFSIAAVVGRSLSLPARYGADDSGQPFAKYKVSVDGNYSLDILCDLPSGQFNTEGLDSLLNQIKDFQLGGGVAILNGMVSALDEKLTTAKAEGKTSSFFAKLKSVAEVLANMGKTAAESITQSGSEQNRRLLELLCLLVTSDGWKFHKLESQIRIVQEKQHEELLGLGLLTYLELENRELLNSYMRVIGGQLSTLLAGKDAKDPGKSGTYLAEKETSEEAEANSDTNLEDIPVLNKEGDIHTDVEEITTHTDVGVTTHTSIQEDTIQTDVEVNTNEGDAKQVNVEEGTTQVHVEGDVAYADTGKSTQDEKWFLASELWSQEFSCNTVPNERIHCILVCDGVQDCSNGADESDCYSLLNPCKESLFRCKTGFCIPYFWRCDMQVDCPDASDEKQCHQE